MKGDRDGDGWGKTTPISEADFKRINAAYRYPKQQLIFQMSWYCCSGIDPLLRLTVESVYEDPTRRHPRRFIRLPTRKNMKQLYREIPVSWKLEAILSDYDPPESGFLFPSDQGKTGSMTHRVFASCLSRAQLRAGYNPAPFSPRSIKLGAIHALLRKGCDPRLVQHLAGLTSFENMPRLAIPGEKAIASIANLL